MDHLVVVSLRRIENKEIWNGFWFFSGKTTAWRVLLTVLNRLENSDGQAHVIDPKAISKDDLYGFLDQNTRMFLQYNEDNL